MKCLVKGEHVHNRLPGLLSSLIRDDSLFFSSFPCDIRSVVGVLSASHNMGTAPWTRLRAIPYQMGSRSPYLTLAVV